MTTHPDLVRAIRAALAVTQRPGDKYDDHPNDKMSTATLVSFHVTDIHDFATKLAAQGVRVET